MSLIERIYEVKMGVADLVNKNRWRHAVRQRFHYMPRYGRLVVDALLEGIWPDGFRERVVAEARFREIFDNLELLHDLLEEMLPIQAARVEERRLLRQGRTWLGGQADGAGSGDDRGSSWRGAGAGGSSGGFYKGDGHGEPGHMLQVREAPVEISTMA